MVEEDLNEILIGSEPEPEPEPDVPEERPNSAEFENAVTEAALDALRESIRADDSQRNRDRRRSIKFLEDHRAALLTISESALLDILEFRLNGKSEEALRAEYASLAPAELTAVMSRNAAVIAELADARVRQTALKNVVLQDLTERGVTAMLGFLA